MINKILKELDRMIEIQQRSADRAEQMSNDVATYLEYKELAAYLKVQDMIKKCAQEAATSEGTDVNSLTQADYNTDDKKSEIRRLIMKFIDLCFEYSDKLSEISNAERYPLIHLELNFFKEYFDMDVSTNTASVFEPIFVLKEYIASDEGMKKLDSAAISKKLSEVLNKTEAVEND